MNWRIVSASVVGTAHQSLGAPCQDHCLAKTWCAPDGSQYLLALIADGAGSARFGKEGAELACQEGMRLIEERLPELGGASPSREDVVHWVTLLRADLARRALVAEVAIREFACTWLAAVVGPDFGMFAQVGDGGIVASRDGILEPVLWPDTGEYANETRFLTDESALGHLQCTVLDQASQEVALFSDGLQCMALVYESRTVHTPFFAPMFAVMHQAGADACVTLSVQLAAFLASARVNERTDDDKTLVLATLNRTP